jgi:acyl-[acyl-carrier-protein]-phospholipid O-acyltransferase/long-chain-fatty-acid--[acyl-carrier-protein] ligase
MSLQTAPAPIVSQAVSSPPVTPFPPYPSHWRSLPRVFLHRARAEWKKLAMVDSTGQSRTYGRLLIESIAMARALDKGLIEGEYVGLFLPPTVPTAVANVAVSLMGRVPVNLNYTAGEGVINSSIDQCGIRTVITSQRALDRFKLTPKGKIVLLEDLPGRISNFDKVLAFVLARLMPVFMLGLFLAGLRGDGRDRTATVIFTSGSTGEPKGVVLTHGNILSNILALGQHLDFAEDEVVLGILPFFHSFGFTVPLWAMICLGKTAAYHFNPLDSRIVGHVCQEHKVSLMVSAPTFARNYLQRCSDEQFQTVRRIVLGAEKLKSELACDLKERWGTVPLEGYGTTELSPVVAVNVDRDVVLPDGRRVPGNRVGSVGRPIPGTAVKAVDQETGADLPVGEVGIICVKGPQVMQGYLNKPEQSAKVVRDGWYSTGDLGKVDEDGFLWITDRLSRFSKIGGEMVPHERVESAIRQAAGVDESAVAVTALPDPKRGERLVVLHMDLGGKDVKEVCQALGASDLPKLWLPGPDDFLAVEAIPMLGTGKLDLTRLRQIARERLGA